MINRVFDISNLILTVVVIYFSVGAFYKVVETKLDHKTIIPVVSGKQQVAFESEKIKPLGDYKNIKKRNIFNLKEKKEEPKPKEPEDKELPLTDLNLKLWGTVSGTGKNAYAVIEEKKIKKQNLYRVGDSIQTAVLKEILREKVILTLNGKDEILAMEEIKSKKKGRSSRSKPSSKSSGKRKQRKQNIKRKDIDKALNNLPGLMKDISVRPHFVNGKPAGIKLTRVKVGSLFRKMGLRSSDIVTNIDGKEITSMEEAMELYGSLKSASNVSVDITRRGKPITINYDIRE